MTDKDKLNVYEEVLRLALCAGFSGVVTAGFMFLLTNTIETRGLIFVSGSFGAIVGMCLLVGVRWKW